MTAFGSNEHLLFMAALFALGLIFWAARSIFRFVQDERHHAMVDRMRADAENYVRQVARSRRDDPQQPAPTAPGAGVDRRSADQPSVERQPAPEGATRRHDPSGAGPQLLADARVSASASHGAPPGDIGGPGHKQSVGDRDPRLQSPTGVQPHHPVRTPASETPQTYPMYSGAGPAAACPSPVAAAPGSVA